MKNMFSNVEDLKKKLLSEAGEYSLDNDLNSKTTEELKFIINAFLKYYKKSIGEQMSDIEILLGFEELLDSIKDGIFGSSFTTVAVALYRDLPTIKEMYNKKTKELFDETRTLKIENKRIDEMKEKVDELERELRMAKDDIDYYRNQLYPKSSKTASKSTSKSTRTTTTKKTSTPSSTARSTSSYFEPSYTDPCVGGRGAGSGRCRDGC